ncbi:MAG: hypothetical protein K1060chlam2_00681 [Chlamydiae bacterium]|nr:hypothetical protein [Chlamydiota bacterium]
MRLEKRNAVGSAINKKILLTGARSLFTLDLARRFHERGYTVFAAETSPFHVCRFSNAISKHFIIPSPRFHSEGFIQALVKITEDEKIDLLIPSFEEIFCLSQGLNRFPDSCTVFCSSYQTLDMLHNKWHFNKKIERLGFATPKSILIKSQEELDKLELKTPYILKPCYSRAAQSILKVTSNRPPKLEIDPRNPLVAQEWLQGTKYCSYSISHQGKLTTHLTYPLDCSLDGHSCLNFESIAHPKIQEWVESFVEKENFTGQIAFDFIEVESDGLYSIECNPRGTSGLHLYRKSDNLPEAFMNPDMPTMYPELGSAKQIRWGMVLYGWKSALSNRTLFHFIKKLFTVRDVIFSLNDIRPSLFQPILFSVYLFKCLQLRIRLPAMFTFDIDWNGQTLTELDQLPYEKSE